MELRRRVLPFGSSCPKGQSFLSEIRMLILSKAPVEMPRTVVRQTALQPLLPVRAVTALLGCSVESVDSLIEDGKLVWVWNLGLDPRGKKELRILPRSVSDWNDARGCALLWSEAIGLFLAPNRGTYSSTELSLALNVSMQHVANLAAIGELATTRRGRKGGNGASVLSAGSVDAFLRRRRHPIPEGQS